MSAAPPADVRQCKGAFRRPKRTLQCVSTDTLYYIDSSLLLLCFTHGNVRESLKSIKTNFSHHPQHMRLSCGHAAKALSIFVCSLFAFGLSAKLTPKALKLLFPHPATPTPLCSKMRFTDTMGHCDTIWHCDTMSQNSSTNFWPFFWLIFD